MGVLAQPILETIETNISMQLKDLPQPDDMSEEDIERLDRVLAVRTDNTQRAWRS